MRQLVNVKTLVLTAKSGNTQLRYQRISTVASDEGLIIADAGEGSILTFPSSNGHCFPVGTVVKSGASTTLSETDYNVIFGGSEPLKHTGCFCLHCF